jgi:hypothetical protein
MKIRSPAVNITTSASVKSASVITLYMGSTVEVLNIKSDYSKILIYANGILREGFIPTVSLREYNDTSAWVDVAERYIGSPYKWGGSTHAGIDCSALVQKCLSAVGRRIPRDTSKIISELHDLYKPFNKEHISLCRGMLIFWQGHVAICIDRDRILHSNAHHAAVEIEPFSEAVLRIAKHTGNPTGLFREDFVERLEYVS